MKTTHTHRDCRECEGTGEITVNNTNPHGYGRDPQCDEYFPCQECGGTGRVRMVPIDPITQIAAARRSFRRYGVDFAARYGALRAQVYSPEVLP